MLNNWKVMNVKLCIYASFVVQISFQSEVIMDSSSMLFVPSREMFHSNFLFSLLCFAFGGLACYLVLPI